MISFYDMWEVSVVEKVNPLKYQHLFKQNSFLNKRTAYSHGLWLLHV